MANEKITGLPAGTIARADDLIETVQYPLGVPTSFKVSMEELPIVLPDIPPATKNALDDEFIDAATLPGGGAAAWTWVNQGGTTLEIVMGKLTVSLPAVNAQNVRGIIKTLPAAPWEFTIKCTMNGPLATSHQVIGLFLYDSASTKCKTFGFGFSTTQRMRVNDWNSPTSHNAQLFTVDCFLYASYLRIKDNNTNWIFSASNDGINWFVVLTQPRNTFLTANRIGVEFYFEAASGTMVSTADFFRRTL